MNPVFSKPKYTYEVTELNTEYDPLKTRTLRQIRRINNAVLKVRNKRLADFDITAAQSDILLYLIRNYKDMDEINQLDIQKFLQLSNPTVSGLLNRLEDKGFITRTPSIKDARYNCVLPTEKALEQRGVMLEHMFYCEDAMLTHFTEDEKEELTRLLNKALESIEALDEATGEGKSL
jgi:DNA-binding MarR family transcriptional regulator